MRTRDYIIITLMLLAILVAAIIGVSLMWVSLFLSKEGLFVIFLLATFLGEMELCSILENKIRANSK